MKTKGTEVIITQSDFYVLQDKYNQAVKDNKTQFKFKGSDIITSYAKYLIEYLKTKFPNTKN